MNKKFLQTFTSLIWIILFILTKLQGHSIMLTLITLLIYGKLKQIITSCF